MNSENISLMIQAKAREFGPRTALCRHDGDPAEHYSYAALDDASGALAAVLRDRGLQPDDRVAILCDSRPRWGVAFFATLRAGGIALPLDTRLDVDDLKRIFDDARPRFLLVAAAQECIAAELAESRDDGLTVFSLEPASANPAWPSIDVLDAPGTHPCVPRGPGDAAVLTYTSGTMGNAKGVVTTFGNLLFQIRACRKALGYRGELRCVSILPLSHLFELTAGFLSVLYAGGTVCYCNSLLPVDILEAMRTHRVSAMATVPLFLKLLERAIRNGIDQQRWWRRQICHAALRCSSLFPFALRRRLFGAAHRRFGGSLRYFVSGGAPLDIATLRFFDAIGLPVYQGYGLAEASPVVATNAPGANRAGSVGRPLPGVEVRFGDGGEILTRGPHVMRAYFGHPSLTDRMIDGDGWLHTGDLGYLDADGYLFVSGRSKNVIVLGSGLKVQPEELEAVLFEHPDIEEGCVVGTTAKRGILNGSEEVCAVAVPSWLAIEGCGGNPEALLERLRRVIEQRAAVLAPGKRPSRIVMRNDPLPRTATRKLRRQHLQCWLAAEARRP